jgi:hypothetical protein
MRGAAFMRDRVSTGIVIQYRGRTIIRHRVTTIMRSRVSTVGNMEAALPLGVVGR